MKIYYALLTIAVHSADYGQSKFEPDRLLAIVEEMQYSVFYRIYWHQSWPNLSYGGRRLYYYYEEDFLLKFEL